MNAYRCLDCDAIGSGDACWACESTNLLRSGPLVDVVVFDLETDHNAHHMTYERTPAVNG